MKYTLSCIIPKHALPSPGSNPMTELPQGGKQYHMVKFPLGNKSPPPPHTHKFHDRGTNTMGDCPRENYTIWQTFPMKEYHMANLPRKKTHSRTSPGGNNTKWQAPLPPPPPRKKFHGRTGRGGGRNPIDGNFYHVVFYPREGNPWRGGHPMWHRIRLILATWCIPKKINSIQL